MSDELINFLRARLDEDNQTASAASPGPWHVNEEVDEVLAVDNIAVADGFALSGRQLRSTTEHIARHHPARVLAEVDTQGQIVRDLENAEFSLGCAESGTVPHDLMTGAVNSLRRVVRLLALVYANHPDYREGWRP